MPGVVFLEWELITTFSICEGVFQNGDSRGPFLFSPCHCVMSHCKHYYRTLFWVNHAAIPSGATANFWLREQF